MVKAEGDGCFALHQSCCLALMFEIVEEIIFWKWAKTVMLRATSFGNVWVKY